ncbi:MAG: hypothetical protein HUU20_28285 [Pirellulales bacterium]|nr:hypothetical protein [Pirellulales bacterium]
MAEDPSRDSCDRDPGYVPVRDYLLYTLSLPERMLRSASGLVGGAVRESACLLVPQAFQNCKTYSIMVGQMLDFLAVDIGGVERAQAASADGPEKVENFVARKAVGNFVEMAGLATFHLSPMLLLAVVSDVAYGSQAYLKELAGNLKQQGVIDPESTIDHVDDLLSAVASAAGTTASAFDTPPLSVDGLRQTIDDTRRAVQSIDPTKVIPQAEVTRLWNDIHEIASNQGVDPLAVSSAMTLYSLDRIGSMGLGALSTIRAAGTLFDRHVIDHYRSGLQQIREKGFYATLAQTSKPYTDAVWKNFSSDRSTITQDVLSGKLVGQAWSTVRRWFGGS